MSRSSPSADLLVAKSDPPCSCAWSHGLNPRTRQLARLRIIKVTQVCSHTEVSGSWRSGPTSEWRSVPNRVKANAARIQLLGLATNRRAADYFLFQFQPYPVSSRPLRRTPRSFSLHQTECKFQNFAGHMPSRRKARFSTIPVFSSIREPSILSPNYRDRRTCLSSLRRSSRRNLFVKCQVTSAQCRGTVAVG